MLIRRIADEAGFQAIHCNENFCLAAHNYRDELTGLKGLTKWGRHPDSQEAFVLLHGEGWLCTKDTSVQVTPLRKNELYIVERGEWHRLMLSEGARVLIAENAAMAEGSAMLMSAQERELIVDAIHRT